MTNKYSFISNLSCIYCGANLYTIPSTHYLYCNRCIETTNVDVLYSYSDYHKGFSMIWLNTSDKDKLYRANIATNFNKITFSYQNTVPRLYSDPNRPLVFNASSGKERMVINPTAEMKSFKILESMPLKYLAPLNFKDKLKTYLIFQ